MHVQACILNYTVRIMISNLPFKHTHARTHSHTHTHTHTRTRTHTQSHTHTHTRAQTCTQNSDNRSQPVNFLRYQIMLCSLNTIFMGVYCLLMFDVLLIFPVYTHAAVFATPWLFTLHSIDTASASLYCLCPMNNNSLSSC